MRKKYLILCHYCGNEKMIESYYKPIETRCNVCNDKHLEIEEVEEEKKDCFGYRFDKPFVEKK